MYGPFLNTIGINLIGMNLKHIRSARHMVQIVLTFGYKYMETF